MKLISIIIPVYNAEKYLKRCLDSVCAQDYKELQIILVDDGSTDLSGDICDDYARKDGRITVVHKSNEGVSKARNDGLKLAEGEFVGFVDSDDYIDCDMYSSMLKAIEKYDADIACCGYCSENELGEVVNKRCASSDELLMDRGEMLADFCQMDGIAGCANWNRLIKNKCVENEMYKSYANGEDVEFLCRVLAKCNKQVCIGKPLYHYMVREGSASRIGFRESYLEALKANDDMLITARDKFPEQLTNMYGFVASWIVSTMQFLYCADKVDPSLKKYAVKEIKDSIRKNQEGINSSSYVTKRDRLFIKLFMAGLFAPVNAAYYKYMDIKRKK